MSVNKKRIDRLNQDGTKEIDYKDIDVFKNFVTDSGKIIPRRVTGVCVYNQSKLATAVKRARFLALVKYTDKH